MSLERLPPSIIWRQPSCWNSIQAIQQIQFLSLGEELNVTDIEPYVEVEVHYETKDKQTIINIKKLTEKDDILIQR